LVRAVGFVAAFSDEIGRGTVQTGNSTSSIIANLIMPNIGIAGLYAKNAIGIVVDYVILRDVRIAVILTIDANCVMLDGVLANGRTCLMAANAVARIILNGIWFARFTNNRAAIDALNAISGIFNCGIFDI